jgi:hypothetical protein
LRAEALFYLAQTYARAQQWEQARATAEELRRSFPNSNFTPRAFVLGPGAGEHGGHVIFQGTPAALLADGNASLTGAYLRGERTIVTPSARRSATRGANVVKGARANNLKSSKATVTKIDTNTMNRIERRLKASQRTAATPRMTSATVRVRRTNTP